MASVTINDQHSIATRKSDRDSPRVILAQHRSLDLLAMSALLLSTPELDVVGAEISLQKLVESSRVLRPDVAIIDVMYPEGAAFDAATDLLENQYTRYVLFLDDAISNSAIGTGHAEQAFAIPNAGYLTKEASMEDICEAIRKLSVCALSSQKKQNVFAVLSTRSRKMRW